MSWDKYGISEWSDGGLTFAPVEAVYNTIRDAILERAEAMPYYSPGSDIEYQKFAPNLLMNEDTWLKFGKWCYLESTLLSMISRYWNHTDSDGDWHKTENGPVRWTEAAMAEAIGQDSLIYLKYDVTIPGFGGSLWGSYFSTPLLTEWCAQAYKIINLLLWTDSYYFNEYRPGYSYPPFWYKSSIGADYAEASADWPAEWSFADRLGVPIAVCETEVEQDNVTLARNYDWKPKIINSDLYKRDDDVYALIEPSGEFYSEGNDWLPNRYCRITEFYETSGTHYFDFRDIFANGVPPNAAETSGWQIKERPVVVSKFENYGNFTFVG